MPVSPRTAPGSMNAPSGYAGLASSWSLYVEDGSPAVERPWEMTLSMKLNDVAVSSSLTTPVNVAWPEKITSAPYTSRTATATSSGQREASAGL